VWASFTKGRLTNCQITQSGGSGVYSSNSTIKIEGEETMIEKNNTSGYGNEYGLRAEESSSIIHILSPLTKESVSKNNRNENYGGRGTIQTVRSFY
jgi:hypothetical protein